MSDAAPFAGPAVTGAQGAAPAPRPVAVAITATVGVLVVATEWGQYVGHSGAALTTLDLVVAAITVGLVPVLLRWPILGAFALAALASLSACATPGATVATLHVAQRRSLGTAVAVGIASAGAHAVRGIWRPIAGLPMGWWLVLVVSCHAALIALGALGQSRRALLSSLRERARRAEAEQDRRVLAARTQERRQIAWEMHDVLAHRLSLLAAYAGAIEYRPDATPERLSQAAGVVRAGAHQALEELREVITVLREDAAQNDDAPQPTLADLPALVNESRAVGCDVEFRNDVADLSLLPLRITRTGYRVVQEGLTNARKHAAGEPISVTVARETDQCLVIEVRNGLRRSSAAVTAPGAGMGLIGLSERIRLAGGKLEHYRAAGDFKLRASIPC